MTPSASRRPRWVSTARPIAKAVGDSRPSSTARAATRTLVLVQPVQRQPFGQPQPQHDLLQMTLVGGEDLVPGRR